MAVGLGALRDGTRRRAPFDGEALRRAAGAAVRSLGPAHRQVALALPARDDAETEAVALGALLGGYAFTRYRAADAGGPGAHRCWPTAPRAARRWTGPGSWPTR